MALDLFLYCIARGSPLPFFLFPPSAPAPPAQDFTPFRELLVFPGSWWFIFLPWIFSMAGSLFPISFPYPQRTKGWCFYWSWSWSILPHTGWDLRAPSVRLDFPKHSEINSNHRIHLLSAWLKWCFMWFICCLRFLVIVMNSGLCPWYKSLCLLRCNLRHPYIFRSLKTLSHVCKPSKINFGFYIMFEKQ